jgi:hypothetical protein
MLTLHCKKSHFETIELFEEAIRLKTLLHLLLAFESVITRYISKLFMPSQLISIYYTFMHTFIRNECRQRVISVLSVNVMYTMYNTMATLITIVHM